MGFEVIVSKELKLVYTKYFGFVERQEMEQALFATLEHPEYVPGMSELTDLSLVEGAELSLKTIDDHTSQVAAHYEMQAKFTAHYVFAPTDLGFELVQAHRKLSQQRIDNLTLYIFRSEAETLKAMGRSETSIAELLTTLSR
ncbi:MAG: hypothetical protein GJ677_10840 [Rhodobacteraceae bacterium]|nr:hypothetical protein [Paracoccaceae bacterium]